jgi:MFS family permease
VKSPEFVRLNIFFLINSFFINFYIGSLDVQLGDRRFLNEFERHDYARLFTLIITLGVLAIPAIGAVMDKYSFPIASGATSLFGLLWALCSLVPNKLSLVAGFIFYTLFRTFFFTFVFAYLADVLGFKYFGVLAGVMFLGGGIVSFLQMPLVEYVKGTCHDLSDSTGSVECDPGNWNAMYVVMAILIGYTLDFSYRDWLIRKEVASSEMSLLYQQGSAQDDEEEEEESSTPMKQNKPFAGYKNLSGKRSSKKVKEAGVIIHSYGTVEN